VQGCGWPWHQFDHRVLLCRDAAGRGGAAGGANVRFSGAYSGLMGRGASLHGPQAGAAGTSMRPGSAGPALGTSFTDPYNYVS